MINRPVLDVKMQSTLFLETDGLEVPQVPNEVMSPLSKITRVQSISKEDFTTPEETNPNVKSVTSISECSISILPDSKIIMKNQYLKKP